ncbi:hypothetical protein [Kibdelosporangium phytohabitans]|uniref:Uncharacterized protein n=1 Tax=Kibdelosporangium phytohabitans TaxID=860235 RepID=A0A0N9HW18_9PSEU|nr:hypothetical protein [Kibdelosporangium phytohabitans]ALG07638.1 hypothetical protein AOZ06_12625 [Kibdelosporangium phytohabitans]ALG07694.1 hypothetical protein AOZ06_12945 [Kibdelosporangium phytohabitans]MBE1471408.1 hypothetical protein [Kibdelosporangium phytohabitans]
MTIEEAAQLLVMAKVLDSRFVEPDDDGFVLRLWSRALEDVPMSAAETALGEYYRSARYRESRDSIMPADIVQWYRDQRRYPPATRQRPEFNPERIHAGVDRVFAALAARKAIGAGEDPDLAQDIADGETARRRLMHAVRCEWPPCRAGEGKPCTGPRGLPLSGGRVHDVREQAALAASGSSPN